VGAVVRLRVPTRRTVKIIVVDGIDGAGKSTLVSSLLASLKPRPCLLNQPNWATKRALALPHIQGKSKEKIKARLNLLAASHVTALAKSYAEVVILDRWFPITTKAYQCGAEGVSEKLLTEPLKWADFRHPDIVLYLDVPLDVALKRMDSADYSKGAMYYARAIQSYKEIACRWSACPWVHLDASVSQETLHGLATAALEQNGIL